MSRYVSRFKLYLIPKRLTQIARITLTSKILVSSFISLSIYLHTLIYIKIHTILAKNIISYSSDISFNGLRPIYCSFYIDMYSNNIRNLFLKLKTNNKLIAKLKSRYLFQKSLLGVITLLYSCLIFDILRANCGNICLSLKRLKTN